MRISAQYDHDRDQLFFRRQHSGEPPIPSKPPLRPLWPRGVGGVVLLLAGGQLIAHAPDCLTAFCGLLVSLGGFALVVTFGHQLGRIPHD